jgi:hypothetical protein
VSRVTVDGRPPDLALHVIAGYAYSLAIPVTGGTLTSPVLSMKTGAGDPYTTDPGVGTATMTTPDTLTVPWTAADTGALNTTTRPKVYRIQVAGVVDGAAAASVIGGTLTTYPTTWARSVPQTSATLSLNNGTTLTLTLTVPPSEPPIDGGAPDEVFLDGIDGGQFDDSFSDTTYDGGTI